MGKKYNLGSASDMKRFSRDLEKRVTNMIYDAANNVEFDYNCPHCNASIKIRSGFNICPVCRREIKVKLNFNG